MLDAHEAAVAIAQQHPATRADERGDQIIIHLPPLSVLIDTRLTTIRADATNVLPMKASSWSLLGALIFAIVTVYLIFQIEPVWWTIPGPVLCAIAAVLYLRRGLSERRAENTGRDQEDTSSA